MSPLLLVPDLTIIYAIDKFDRAFSKNSSFSGQQEDIVEILTLGHDGNSYHREIYRKYHPHPCRLAGQCKIIRDEGDENCWRVTFEYMGKVRKLIYFHHRNFYETWPEEITDINHLMSMGATFNIEMSEPELLRMIRDRTGQLKYYKLDNRFEDTEYDEVLKARDSSIGVTHIPF